MVDRFIVLLESHPANNISCDVDLVIEISLGSSSGTKKIVSLILLTCFSRTNWSFTVLDRNLRKQQLICALTYMFVRSSNRCASLAWNSVWIFLIKAGTF